MSPDGTCYLANAATAALRERLGLDAVSGQVPASMLAGVEVSRVRVKHSRRFADLCHSDTIHVTGMNREVHTTSDYETTRAWAAHFHAEGFGGVQYLPRHTTGQDDRSYAVFGPGGVATAEPDLVLPAVEVAAATGLAVLPDTPNLSEVRVIQPPSPRRRRR